MSPARGTRVIAYIRVSTEEQTGGADAQRDAISRYAELYGLVVVAWEVDMGESGRDLKRPGITRALEAARDGKADGIVVAKLDRLTRSVRDMGTLADEIRKDRWQLFSVNDHIDTRTAAGRLMVNVLVSVAQWEREIIGERTRAALESKRARGVRLGRAPEPMDPAVIERVRILRSEGLSYDAIAAALNETGTPSPRGARWHPTTVARVLAHSA